jgi:hypothetical protein
MVVGASRPHSHCTDRQARCRPQQEPHRSRSGGQSGGFQGLLPERDWKSRTTCPETGCKRQVVRTSGSSARDHPCRALRWYESRNSGAILLVGQIISERLSPRDHKKKTARIFPCITSLIYERIHERGAIEPHGSAYRATHRSERNLEAEGDNPRRPRGQRRFNTAFEQPPRLERHVAICPQSTALNDACARRTPCCALLVPLRLRIQARYTSFIHQPRH